jgi:Leucine-rich repeat (LRR) protein
MKLLVFFPIFILLSIECYPVQDWNHQQLIEFMKTYVNAHLSINCFKYTNDDKIRKSFPFCVELNPKEENPSQTYALKDRSNNIYYLNIFNEKFFPPIAFCLKHLKELYIYNTSFIMFGHQLPPMIKNLAQSLISLEIHDTTITHLLKEIGKLRQLQKLKLSNTGLISLPNEIGDLSLLTFLSLRDNKLTFLPKTMGNLRLLQQLILTNNQYLRSVESIHGLPALQNLQMDHCSIERIPLNLPQLFYLSMSYNNLTILVGIQSLGYGTNNKKSFYFDKNHIKKIPFEVQYVPNLFILNLNYNQLKHLPDGMSNIPTLDELYMKNNSFSHDYLQQIVEIFSRTNAKLKLEY